MYKLTFAVSLLKVIRAVCDASTPCLSIHIYTDAETFMDSGDGDRRLDGTDDEGLSSAEVEEWC